MNGEIVNDGPSLKFPVCYETGHDYPEEWLLSDLFCPACGKKTLWIEQDEEDCEGECAHLCGNCGAGFVSPGVNPPYPENWQDQQRIARFKGQPPPEKIPRLTR